MIPCFRFSFKWHGIFFLKFQCKNTNVFGQIQVKGTMTSKDGEEQDKKREFFDQFPIRLPNFFTVSFEQLCRCFKRLCNRFGIQ